MDETSASKQKEFPEWMVTQALAAYLGRKGREDSQRMAWLFGLNAEVPHGGAPLNGLCGFNWDPEQVRGGAEDSLKDNEDDRGKIPSDDFRRSYLMMTPDFRYWTKEQHNQLIIEAKGTPKPVGQRDRFQAGRYFTYLRDSGYAGAIVYFVPNPKEWLNWLIKFAGGRDIPFGVVDLRVQVVPQVANELVRVVGEALVQSADLLEIALRFSKTT